MSVVISIVLAFIPMWFGPAAQQTSMDPTVVGQVSVQGEAFASQVSLGSTTVLLPANATGIGGIASNPIAEQTLTTTVADPEHPDEPWVITTYRRDGESYSAFINRHREMVDAVRGELQP